MEQNILVNFEEIKSLVQKIAWKYYHLTICWNNHFPYIFSQQYHIQYFVPKSSIALVIKDKLISNQTTTKYENLRCKRLTWACALKLQSYKN